GGQRSRGVDVYDVDPERKLYRTQQHTTRRHTPDARPGYGWQRVAYGPGSAVRRGAHGPRTVYAPGRPLLLCAASAALQRWAVLLAFGFDAGALPPRSYSLTGLDARCDARPGLATCGHRYCG